MNSNKNTQKGLYIKNFGCQMNVYDGDRMQEMMSPYDYGSVNSVEDADLVILNTCHIREKATEKIYSELGRIKKTLAGKGRKTTIAVAGCVAQAEGKELIKRAPIIDLVFGPLTYHHLPEILKSFENDKSKKKKAIIAFSMNGFYQGDWIDSMASRFIDELPEKHLEKNSFFDEEINNDDDFEFNQDFEIEDGARSPGWIRYQKRIK